MMNANVLPLSVVASSAAGRRDTSRHSERREVVVLSADMRGFTQNSQILPASTVLALLDAFFSSMNEMIECNGGVMVNVQGDTLLAAFGSGTTGESGDAPETLCRTITCAQQMQTSFQAMADEWTEEFGIRTALGIGINRGEAVVGEIGVTGGTPDLRVHTVFGDCVGLAVRFMRRARAGEIVFSAAVKQAMQESCTVTDTVALPELLIGGREPVELYGVIIETRLDFT
ncbi:MAG: adenylate/guanylate cyclase domain-containing protein [Betaproteobacteria bacterium]